MKLATFLAFLLVLVSAVCSWGVNIYKLISMVLANDPLGGLFIGRALGIFVFPIGVILGVC